LGKELSNKPIALSFRCLVVHGVVNLVHSV
jgi:hypothetical protein